ncbi:MAG TPA: DinB family protein [Acidimicrobiales bacterium]
MTDHRSPRIEADELSTLMALLQYQRESLVRKVEGVTPVQAAWSPVPTGTNLLWLVTHMADAEQTWMVRRFAGLPTDVGEEPPPEGDGLAHAVGQYRATWVTVDALVAGADGPDAPCLGDETIPPATLRWVLAHLLEETARHAGHADIIREMVDGTVGR